MKKGQLLSQPFTWIFALVVIALVVVFGWSQIGKLMCLSEEVDFKNFETNLGKDFREILLNPPGSTSNPNDLIVPDDVLGVCFVEVKPGIDFSGVLSEDLKVELELRSQGVENDNVFFIVKKNSCLDKASVARSLAIKDLRPLGGVQCFNTKKDKKLNVILEAKPRYVELRANE